MFLSGNPVAGYGHNLNVLHTICNKKMKHKWYMLIDDSVYVHMDVLLDTVAVLSHRDKFVIGKAAKCILYGK